MVELEKQEPRYPDELVARLIKYFKREYDRVISREEAQAFLDSLSRLYDALSKVKE